MNPLARVYHLPDRIADELERRGNVPPRTDRLDPTDDAEGDLPL